MFSAAVVVVVEGLLLGLQAEKGFFVQFSVEHCVAEGTLILSGVDHFVRNGFVVLLLVLNPDEGLAFRFGRW